MWKGYGSPLWAVGDLVVGEFSVNSLGGTTLDTDTEVQAVDGRTGVRRWYIDDAWRPHIDWTMADSRPIVERAGGGATLIGTWSDSLTSGSGVFAVDIATGEMMWHTTDPPDGPGDRTIGISQDMAVLFDLDRGSVTALDADSGTALWTKSEIFSVDAAAGGVVIARVEDDASPVVAFDARTGAELWRDTESFDEDVRSVYSEGDVIALYGGRDDGETDPTFHTVLYAASTGRILGSYEDVSSCFRGTPPMIACRSGSTVVGIATDTGSTGWQIDEDSEGYQATPYPVGVSGGYLYVTRTGFPADTALAGVIDIATGQYLGDISRAPFAVGTGFGLVDLGDGAWESVDAR